MIIPETSMLFETLASTPISLGWKVYCGANMSYDAISCNDASFDINTQSLRNAVNAHAVQICVFLGLFI